MFFYFLGFTEMKIGFVCAKPGKIKSVDNLVIEIVNAGYFLDIVDFFRLLQMVLTSFTSCT